MSELRAAIDRMLEVARAGLQRCPTTLPRVQKELNALDMSSSATEPLQELEPFLREAQRSGASSLKRSALNKVLRNAWLREEFDHVGEEALTRSLSDPSRSSDQAVIDGYLNWFPIGRPIMDVLAPAAEGAAMRHDWSWAWRATDLKLFRPEEGPANLASGILSPGAGSVGEVFMDAGLNPNPNATRFGREVFVRACGQTAALRGDRATGAQERLLSIFDKEEQAGQISLLVRALLEPWINEKPEPAHRQRISDLLLDQLGDPRLSKGRWETVRQDLAASFGSELAANIVQVFKRWLDEVAMREFFRAIAKTTDRPDQWRDREAFWIAYLDADVIQGAWPALGPRAKTAIEDSFRQSGERLEYGRIFNGPSQSSSIIMTLGDLRISEWSDNGSCRFWNANDPAAPKMYASRYDGDRLRTTHGRSDFSFLPHVPPSPGWEAKFAGLIYRRTGVKHPEFGGGIQS